MSTNNDYLNDIAGDRRRSGLINNELLEKIAASGLGGLTPEEKVKLDSLDSKADLVDGKVPEHQLPSYIDNVSEHPTQYDFPETGESNVIYISVEDNAGFRWSGTQYVQISSGITIGETASTAFAGSRGVALEGLSANKVDKASASNRLYATNHAGTQVTIPYSETVANSSAVVRDSSGRISTADPLGDSHAATKKYVDTAIVNNELEPGTTSQYYRGDKTWQPLNKTAVGLGNVDNTSDEDKPVSAPQRNALGVKADLVNGKVPTTQLPSYVDNVQEYASLAEFPVTGTSNVVYLAIDTNKPYRWGGSSYVEISSAGVALGETESTAYRGDRGKAAYDHSLVQGNPHNTTKGDVGLGSVDNTSDINKPVSTATQTALDDKMNKPSTPETVPVVNSSGDSGTLPYAIPATASTLPLRDSGGRVSTETPTSAKHAANKEYADRVWMPDYSNMETTNRITSNGGTWTVPAGKKGWVKLFTRTYTGGVLNQAIFLVNGKVMEHIWQEATAGTGTARSGSRSGLFQVKGGDTVQVHGNLERSCYFIPGIWVS